MWRTKENPNRLNPTPTSRRRLPLAPPILLILGNSRNVEPCGQSAHSEAKAHADKHGPTHLRHLHAGSPRAEAVNYTPDVDEHAKKWPCPHVLAQPELVVEHFDVPRRAVRPHVGRLHKDNGEERPRAHERKNTRYAQPGGGGRAGEHAADAPADSCTPAGRGGR